MADTTDDPYLRLGVPRGARRAELQRAFRDEMQVVLAVEDGSEAAAERVRATQRAYATLMDRTPREQWWTMHTLRQKAVALAIVFLGLAIGIGFLPGAAHLQALFAGGGVLMIVVRAVLPQRDGDAADTSLAQECARLVEHVPTIASPSAIAPPSEGAFLAATIALLSDGEPISLVPRGAPLPHTSDVRLRTRAAGARHVDVRLRALGGGELELLHARLHALRPIADGDEIAVEVTIDALGRIAIAATDGYARTRMRAEVLAGDDERAPVEVAGYRA
jgi:hypothetical protein